MGKQVKTPRFYVDIPTFLHATGDLHWADSPVAQSLLYMNPSNPYLRPEEFDSSWLFKIGNFDNEPKTSFPINFVALLNHNLASDDAKFKVKGIHKNFTGNDGWPTLTTPANYKANILNANIGDDSDLSLEYNGTTIFELNNPNNELNHHWRFFGIEYQSEFDSNLKHQLGSLVVGKYWDAPNSPDLSLTMSRRFDGIKKQKTIGGKTLANIYYDGPTQWTMNRKEVNSIPSQVYKYPPFELDTIYAGSQTAGEDMFNRRAKGGLGRKGLRSWNLTFSYISEDDMWMKNEVSNTLISDNESYPSLNDPNPMLADESFNFVWNCTLGGTLPFIFQPDNDNNNPDQFSICTFRDNTLSVKQVAYNTYSLSITIDEVA